MFFCCFGGLFFEKVLQKIKKAGGLCFLGHFCECLKMLIVGARAFDQRMLMFWAARRLANTRFVGNTPTTSRAYIMFHNSDLLCGRSDAAFRWLILAPVYHVRRNKKTPHVRGVGCYGLRDESEGVFLSRIFLFWYILLNFTR